MTRRVFGIVLAAGEGRRMGRPKAGLLAHGVSLLDRHACTLHAHGCDAIALVVRPPVAGVAARGPRPASAWLVPAATASQAESLAVGLRALESRAHPAPGDVVVIMPVDMFPPDRATFSALAGALTARVLAATPTHRGRRGHPPMATFALLAAAYLGERRASRAPPLRDVLRALGGARVRIEVDDPAVLGDFDTPDDWRAAFSRAPALFPT